MCRRDRRPHWFNVADILAEPDVGLVQLHGVSSTGAKEWHQLDAGAVLGQCLDFPVHRFPVMSGHRVTIQTAATLTGAAAHPAPCLCGWQSR